MSLSNAVFDIDAAIAELRARIPSSAERRTAIADRLVRIRDHLRSEECGIERSKECGAGRAKGRNIMRAHVRELGIVMAEDRRRR